MKAVGAMGIPSILSLWRDRAKLSEREWAVFYEGVRTICLYQDATAKAGDIDDVTQYHFDRFFVRRVIQSTPSEPLSPHWIRVIYDWYRAGPAEETQPSKPFRLIESRSGHRRDPQLDEIEESVFRPSDALCFKLAGQARGQSSANELADDPDLQRRVESLLQADPAEEPVLKANGSLPEPIADYLRRKVAAACQPFPQIPTPGQIVCVERLIGPEGELDEDLARPLCAVIDALTEDDGVWWGWMVGSEPDYACEWDFVLGSDDEPRDPLATTVQLWNPVRIYLPSVARVIGQLTPQRHAALRSLVADFLSGDEATQVNVAPQEGQTSFLVFRATSAGHQVTTGLPLSGPDDPRRVYQTLYEGAADVLRQPALLAARAAALANWLPRASVQQTGVNRFVATAAHNAELTLELEYQLPGSGKPLVLMQKMGQARHDATLRLGDLSIEFIGGIAAPDSDAASRVASLLGLSLAFVEWPALSKEFARSRGETSGRMREVIKSILDAATSAKRASHEVFQFLFAELAPIGAARSLGATSVPLVLDMASLGDSRFRLELWWFEPPPEVGAVEVFVDGREVQLRTPANWIKSPTVLELDGCNVEPASLAAARFEDGVLRLNLWTTSETRI